MPRVKGQVAVEVAPNPFPEGSAEYDEWAAEVTQNANAAVPSLPATHKGVRVTLSVSAISQAKTLATLAGGGTDYRTILSDAAESSLAQYISKVRSLLDSPDNDMPF